MTQHTLDVETIGYNVGAGPLAAKLDDLETFLAHAKTADATPVILGQEWGDRPDLWKAFHTRHPSYRIVWDSRSNAGRKTPIIYDSAALKLPWYSLPITVPKGTYWGHGGKGETRSPGKRLAQARLRHRRSKIKLKVLNHHLVASAFSTGGAEGKRRRTSWTRQANRFFRAAQRSRAPVLGGADWNAEKTNPRLQAARKRCPKWVWDSKGPTHKKRTIDLYGHKTNPRIKLLAAGVHPTHGSRHRQDHAAPWQRYRITDK